MKCISFFVFVGLIFGRPLHLLPERNSTGHGSIRKQNQLNVVANLTGSNKVSVIQKRRVLIETKSTQDIETIKDYLRQLKTDIRDGASSYVQDSVDVMELLAKSVKNMKNRLQRDVEKINNDAESQLLTIKAVEELVGLPIDHSIKIFLNSTNEQTAIGNTSGFSASDGHSMLIETRAAQERAAQEIQSIKNYLDQMKSNIRQEVISFVKGSISLVEEFTVTVKKLRKDIEATINRINSNAESKLLAIKAIGELIGLSNQAKSLVEYMQTVNPRIHTHNHFSATTHVSGLK